MKSLERGIRTSNAEVVSVSPHGIWLSVRGREYFLPYEEFPWFQEARLSEIHRVRLVHGRFLRWEDLDVELVLESVEHPDRYPLKYQ
ncbi:MAG: DUF2442 domain-containing protein [Candidatus Omnitrophica bacterium]|nr:DUF2442 domain-containing protein [Candidatus Omnitrophota bacterium]